MSFYNFNYSSDVFMKIIKLVCNIMLYTMLCFANCSYSATTNKSPSLYRQRSTLRNEYYSLKNSDHVDKIKMDMTKKELDEIDTTYKSI